MNNQFDIIIQGLSTAFMNLLIFQFLKRVYMPKFKNKALNIMAFIITSIIYVSENFLASYLNFAILNTIFLFVYINLFSILFFIAIHKITTTNKQPKTNRSNPTRSPKKKQY